MIVNEKEYALIVAKNLKRIMYESGKTQADVARDLHINKSTLSCWMNGVRTPRMKSIDMLCHYFNVLRSDIMEEQSQDQIIDFSVLSNNEKELIISFRDFNAEGQEKVLNYINDLAATGLYNIFNQDGISKKEA